MDQVTQLAFDLYPSYSLPEAVALELIGSIDTCLDNLRPTMVRLAQESADLRQSILCGSPDLIQVAAEAEPLALGAVDGIHLLQPAMGSDFAAVVAFRLDGQQQLHHLATVDTVGHSVDIDSILGGVRNIFETSLLKDAHEADPLILDGSYWSILQDINRMFYVRHHTRGQTGLWRPFLPHLERFIEDGVFPAMLKTGAVLANSKRAVSDTFVRKLVPDLADTIADRALFSVVLEPGEYTRPVSILGGTTGRLGVYTSDEPLSWSADRDRVIIEEVYQEIRVIYYRPYEWSPAYRLEMTPNLVKKIDRVLAGFKRTLIAPDILEPYPQFLVDKLCKQIPTALLAVVEGTTNALRHDLDPDLLRKLLGAYRTR